MRGLTNDEILRVWEEGTAVGITERALIVLCAADPGRPRDEFASLPLGQRDALLLELRRLTFGPMIEAQMECSKCGEQLECALSCAALVHSEGGCAQAGVHSRDLDGRQVDFRLPTSEDLIAVTSIPDRSQAARALAARCVSPADTTVGDGSEALDPKLEAALETWVTELDPLSEIELSTTCPRCGDRTVASFDVADYLWREIRGAARRLLRDIDVLASAYGWSEREILALSDHRRNVYLELAW